MKLLKRVLPAVSATVLLFLTLGAWSLASPVGAAPDDDFHLASIWCAQGEREGLCEPGTEADSLLVPSKAIHSMCYAYNAQITASCQGKNYLEEGFGLEETDRFNKNHQYPGGFYLVASVFSGDNIAISTIAIRLFNSALFAVLLVGAWCVLPRSLRFVLAGSTALTFIPTGVFFVASVNPSSWAVISGALLVPTLLGWFLAKGTQKWLSGALALLSAALGVAARGDSAAYAAIGALAVAVLAFEPTRRYLMRCALPGLVVLIGAVTLLSARQSALALAPRAGGEGVSLGAKGAHAFINLLSLPNLWNGIYGQEWGLGWLDTYMPGAVPGIGIFLVCGVLFAALHTLSWRRTLALLGVGSALVVVPLAVLIQSGAMVGEEVQPRYVLPLITMFIAVAIAPSVRNVRIGSPLGPRVATWQPPLHVSPLQLWGIGIGLAVANTLALFHNMRRYTTAGSYLLDRSSDWWWIAGPSPFATLAIGSISFSLLMLIFIFMSNSETTTEAKAAKSELSLK